MSSTARRAAVARRTAGLGSEALTLLDGAAVAGPEWELPVAAFTAGLADEAAAAGLAELVASGLVTRAAAGRHRFVPPSLRDGVYAGIGAGRRLGAHARCAESLQARGAGDVVVAAHLERSARPGDEAAVVVLRRAAATLLDAEPERAGELLEAVMRLLDAAGTPQAQRWPDALQLARALVGAGRPDRACAVLAAPAAADTDPAVAEALVLTRAQAQLLRGDDEAALAQLRQLGTEDRPGRGDEATGLLALAAACGGDAAVREAALDRARRSALGAPGACWLAYAELLTGDGHRALAALARARAAGARAGLAPVLAAAQALALVAVDDLDGALAAAERGVAAARGVQLRAWCGWVRASVLLRRGEAEAALRGARQAGAHAAPIAPVLLAIGCWWTAQAELATGPPDTVSPALIAGCGGAALPLVPAPLRSSVHATLAATAAERGDLDAALAWAAHAQLAAARLELHGPDVAAARARASAERVAEHPPTPIAGLTPRQCQVAGLVAAGHTNRVIAERLAVSDKTVEAHLAAIFGRLGVGTRAAVAAAVALATPPGRARG